MTVRRNLIFFSLVASLFAGVVVGTGASAAEQTGAGAAAASTTTVRDAGTITSVTVHRGWASVVRRVEVIMTSEVVVLNLSDLPENAIHDSIQAEISGAAATAVTIREIQARPPKNLGVYDVRVVLALNDPESDEQSDLVLGSMVIVKLNYVVTHADWVPTYTIRADSETRIARITCDLVIGQSSGEDWNDVVLTVSSAVGSMPRWDSVFQEKRMGTADRRSSSGNPMQNSTNGQSTDGTYRPLLDLLGGDASIFGSHDDSKVFDWSNSPIIERTLSYRVSVPDATLTSENRDLDPAILEMRTDFGGDPLPSAQSERIRFRLDEFTARPPFRYVAAPAIAQNAFLVGTIRNSRPYHMLPGAASLFLDSQYSGEMNLPDFAPGELIDIAFGTEPDVLVHQREIDRRQQKTGLLGDGRETQINYHISIQNNTGRPATIEVWDQIPVADDGQISISVDELSQALSKDQNYVDSQRPRGLLRWDIAAPVANRSNAPLTIDYTLVISHHRDVTPAWLPK